ncbi:dUTP diphosphatase [Winslowiella arboricola]|uniref:dUTP diphosphatase n=1 Tax=Winslowiella arboricola TaxID=2978220 RepID=UPI00225E403F|nr:dUTP diphosphatase [Winslowiella arboricola]MCU5773031.1 dUTP diphosphatase [Winslowiella arboricola]
MKDLLLTKAQIQVMLNLQDSINSVIDQNWREKAHPWYRAIWTECAEMLEHVGWKWWKYTEKDFEQIHLEIVDIWHFALSEMLMKDDIESISNSILLNFKNFTLVNEEKDIESLRISIEDFALFTLKNKSFSEELFVQIMVKSNLNPLQLYKTYVGKNTLNKFRQNNGYKTGEYIKIWDEQEDNVWLSKITAQIPPSEEDYANKIYNSLEKKYTYIKNKIEK